MALKLIVELSLHKWSAAWLPQKEATPGLSAGEKGEDDPSASQNLHPGQFAVTGWAFSGNQIISGNSLTQAIGKNCTTFESFITMVDKLEGHFSIVVFHNGEIWLVCSISRSYPLFYAITDDQVWTGDDPSRYVKKMGNHPLDPEIGLWFLQFGVTPADKTLAQGVSQVRPGQIIRITAEGEVSRLSVFESLTPIDNIQTGSYKLNSGDRKPVTDQDNLGENSGRRVQTGSPSLSASGGSTEEETAEVIRTIFARYLPFLSRHKLLLPLTGGYDSRLLACLLREAGHPHVTCATWGRPGNQEMVAARQVAAKMGYPHLQVEYDLAMIRRYTRDALFGEYIDYAGHLSSMPFMQEYPAVRHLIEKKAIEPGTIVLPGHPGDFLRGSHLYPALPGESSEGIFNTLITRFSTSRPLTKKEWKILKSVFKKEFPGDSSSGFEPVDFFQSWDLEERQCKLIANSNLVYDFFGLIPVMPLYNKELISYFTSLPYQQQLGGTHYFNTLNNHFFRKYGVELPVPSTASEEHPFNPLKEFLLRATPRFLKKWWYPVEDDVFYREITRLLMSESAPIRYRHPVRSHFYNCYLAQWYLNRVENSLLSVRG